MFKFIVFQMFHNFGSVFSKCFVQSFNPVLTIKTIKLLKLFDS